MGNNFHVKGEQAYDEVIHYLSDNADVIDKKTGRRYISSGAFNYYYKDKFLLAMTNSKFNTVELGSKVDEETIKSIEQILNTERIR